MIIFRDEIQKADAEESALQELRAFLDPREPALAAILVNTWNNQGNAITFKELREAVMQAYESGGTRGVELFERLVAEWRQDYSRFVMQELTPRWTEAIHESNARLRRKFPKWTWDGFYEGVKEWTDTTAAQFVTNSTAEQISAIREVVKLATELKTNGVDSFGRVVRPCGVDELARYIRPMVGLNRPQIRANWNYRNALVEKGLSQKRVIELTERYSARQIRYRAQMIARTELAFASGQGAYMGAKAAQKANLMGTCVKRWCTAADERVCGICGALDGVEVEMDEDFNFPTRLTHPDARKMNPAHPHCRCTVLIVEVAPPEFTPTA